ncbi:DUF421 domain-containing protein [Radiobacillus deserti]|uniref:DUF421 domain-containing protein n=2 Tax=Radiobacillus deserti TaxID=2594883 RepID=A0A516KLA2_9BACI|nr:DUF421 domain-containing protein [Radiobacillus deserti]
MELDVGNIIFRTVLTYCVIVLIMRFMGKREIGELSILDIVVFMMIAEMAVFAVEDPSETFMHALLPMGTLFIIQRTTAYLSLKNTKFRAWFDGKPSVIISKGKIDEDEMRKQRYNFNDLMQQLRENGTRNIQDVEFAILETSGKLSVFEKSKKGIEPISPDNFVVPLVVDGNIRKDSLDKINKTEEWLLENLEKRGHSNISDISFCSLDSEDRWYIDIKDEIK